MGIGQMGSNNDGPGIGSPPGGQLESTVWRILVVDDDPTVLSVVGEMLSMLGHETLLESDGRSAVSIFAASQDEIDLCIVDQRMPRMSGEDVIVEMRRINPLAVVICLTGDPSVKPGVSTAADLVAVKPFGLSDLADAIKRVMLSTRSRVGGL